MYIIPKMLLVKYVREVKYNQVPFFYREILKAPIKLFITHQNHNYHPLWTVEENNHLKRQLKENCQLTYREKFEKLDM